MQSLGLSALIRVYLRLKGWFSFASKKNAGMLMKSYRVIFMLLVLALLAASTPALAVSKEIIQLQTQVQQLQDQMTHMQQSFDERMGIMRNLVEQQSDSVNKVNASFQTLQQTLTKQHDEQGARNDQVSGQIQALNDSLDELKARLAKISAQLDQLAASGQNITQPGGTNPQQQAPPPEVLYNNGLRDYNANKMELASQEFADYLKFYPTTDLAGNAQFYVAEIEYRQGNYAAAVKDYDKVLEQYPGGNKSPAAQLKKGLSLVKLGQQDAGVRELHSLIQRYPRSPEATNARDELRKLGVSTTTRAKRG
jgi:tol-pal system protein YbgF